MSDAVRCGRCRALYHLQHEKCPRCGARAPKPVAKSETAGTRLGTGLSVVLLWSAVAVVAATAVVATWSLRERIPQPVKASAAGPAMPSRALQALTGANAGPATKPKSHVPPVAPFLESSKAARVSYLSGNLEAAHAQFKAAVESRPDNTEALNNLGQVLVRLGRPSEALPLLEKAVELDPANWQFRFNLARALGLVGDWNRAVASYVEAQRLFPDDYATAFNLAQALHRAGREDQAVTAYRVAIGLKPDDATFYLALGTSEEKLKHTAEAAAAYRKAAELDPHATLTPTLATRATQLEQAAKAQPAPPPAQPGVLE